MAMDVCKPVTLLLIFCILPATVAYKHVIFMHGVLADASEFNDMVGWLNKHHPGTTTSLIKAYEGKSSLESLWKQSDYIRDIMSDIMKNHTDGVHLLCFSQGGLVCRAVLETLATHNVHNFVSLSCPQGGQYGETSYVKKYFPFTIKQDLYEIFYTKEVQKYFAIANYWNDPHHQDYYKDYSVFLAVLNNQSTTDVNATRAQFYKDNFSRLKNVVMIGGPDDGVITPWQSSHFAAYDENENVLEMRKQEWYVKDSFGLQTLDKKKALHTYVVPGILHKNWHVNYTIFTDYILKWLD